MLSSAWRVAKTQSSFYTGGVVQCTQSKGSAKGSQQAASLLGTLNDDDFILTDLATNQRVAVIPANEDAITAFALHPNGQSVVVACQSQLLKHFELPTPGVPGVPRLVRSWRGHNLPVSDMTFDSTGTMLATASTDRSVRVWNVAGGFVTHNFTGHKSLIIRVFFHPNPSELLVAACCEDGAIYMWHLEHRKAQVLSNHMSAVTSLAWSPAQGVIVSTGRDRVVSVWKRTRPAEVDVTDTTKSKKKKKKKKKKKTTDDEVTEEAKESKQRAEYVLVKTTPVYEVLESVVYWADRSCFLLAGERGAVYVLRFDETANKPVFVCTYNTKLARTTRGKAATVSASSGQVDMARAVTYLHVVNAPRRQGSEFLPTLLTVTAEHNFVFYDVQESDSTFSFDRAACLVGYNDEIVGVRCLPDNQHAVVATNSAEVRVLNLNTLDSDVLSPPQLLAAAATSSSSSSPASFAHSDVVLTLDVSKDGQFIVTGSKDRTVALWKLVSDSAPSATLPQFMCVGVGRGHTEAVGAVVLSKAGSVTVNKSPLFALSVSRDRTLKLWDCSSARGKEADASPGALPAVHSVVAHEKDINTIDISPNSQIVATGSQDKTIKLWSVPGLEELGVLRGHRRGVWTVTFSPVDKVVASCSGDKTVRVWSLKDQTCLRTFQGHSSAVLNVRFINRGLQLLSSGVDCCVKLWTIRTNECVNTLADAHSSKIWALDVCPDEKRFVSGGTDSALHVWEDVTQEEKEQEAKEHELLVVQEEEMKAYMQQAKYADALLLALDSSVARPRVVYRILRSVVTDHEKRRLQRPAAQPVDPSSSATPSHSDAVLATEFDGIISRVCAARAGDDEKMEDKDDAPMNGPDLAQQPPSSSASGDSDKQQPAASAALARLLEYAREWNTNSKYAHVTSKVLASIFRTVPAEDIIRCLKAAGSLDTLSSLLVYSERHYKRTTQLLRRSFLLDYTAQSMAVLNPTEDAMDISLQQPTSGPASASPMQLASNWSDSDDSDSDDNDSDDDDEKQDEPEEEASTKATKRSNRKAAAAAPKRKLNGVSTRSKRSRRR